MGILNSNQILKGARNPAGDRLYTYCYLTQAPTAAAAAGVITFTGGNLEIEGKNYSLNTQTFDLATTLANIVRPGEQYTLAAVPAYTEPATRAAAEAAGINYFVENLPSGESLARYFINSNIEQAVAAAGGATALAQRVYVGTATASDISVFNAYSEELERLKDPRYAVQPLAATGFAYILAQITPQDNSSQRNALLNKSRADFDLLRSQLPMLYTERRVMTVTQANARYANLHWLISSARSYASQADAISDINPSAPLTITAGATPVPGTGATVVAVVEFTYPSFLPIGQTGSEPYVVRILSKSDVSALGRINPIYLENTAVQLRFGNDKPSKLTLYADPCELVRFTVGGTSAAPTVTNLTAAYDTMI